MSRRLQLLVVAIALLVASCADDAESFPAAFENDPIENLAEIDLAGSTKDHDGNFSWSLIEPLTRNTVGLPPVDETEQDSFAYSLNHPELLNVELLLPDGELFTQQPRAMTGELSRIEGVKHSLTLAVDGVTLAEAEAELLANAERFNFDPAQIAQWRESAVDYFENSDDILRQRLNLPGTQIGDLEISAAAVANPATNDASIFWYFFWPN